MELKYNKIQTTGTDTPLKIVKGHFATNHAHTNYYFDLTTVKSRLSEAGGIAQALVHMYLYDMIVDTIVCMEGTEVIGTLLAQELTKGGFMSKNAHKTIYVIKPEAFTSGQCFITLVHTSYKKKLLAISDKVLIIKRSNIAEGQLERRRKDMTNLILLAVVIRIIVSIIVVNGNAYLRYTESGIA